MLETLPLRLLLSKLLLLYLALNLFPLVPQLVQMAFLLGLEN